MSLFLVGALNCLAFSMILPTLMIVALEGYEGEEYQKVAYAAVVHLGASLLTYANTVPGGCVPSVVLVLLLGASQAALGVHMAWRRCGDFGLRRRALALFNREPAVTTS